MTILYVCDGTPERIPAIGTMFSAPPEACNGAEGVLFKVEAYGEQKDLAADCPIKYNGKPAYAIELIGCLVLPAGSPIKELDKLLGM